MLKMISWLTFITAGLFLLLAYYAVVAIRYYRSEIAALLKGKMIHTKVAGHPQSEADKKPELFKGMEKAIVALKESLPGASADGSNREEVLAILKRILRQYGYLKGTPYAIAIDHFLLRETNQSVRLNEEEVRGLWD